MNLETLDSNIARTLQQAGRKLLVRACQGMETDLPERRQPRMLRGKKRPLYLLARFGWLKVHRFGCMLSWLISSP